MKNGKFVLHHSKEKKGTAVYIYHKIAWYYRKDKKPYRNIIKNLGKLTNDEIEHYKNTIACLNHDPNYIPCNINEVEVDQSLEYLPCAIGIHFWDYWELSDVFPKEENRKDVLSSDIAKILTTLRFVQICSKSYTTKLYNETTLPLLTGILPKSYNKSRIFRELENIENRRELLGRHIYNHAKKCGYTKGQLLFYDLSSGNFSGLRCLMAKWGHCKDGYYVHVVLLLVITPEGYPIYWDILEGNTADAKTIEDLIVKVENIYGHLESVICFDRGIVSDDNLKLLQGKNIKFITALDGNQLSHFDDHIDVELFNEVKLFNYKIQSHQINAILSKNGFSRQDNNLYYKEIILSEEEKKLIEDNTDKLALSERRYFLAFNPELAYLTAKHRKERVNIFKEWIKEYNEELQHAIRSRNKDNVENRIKKEIRKRKLADVEINYKLESVVVVNKNNKREVRKATTYKIKLSKIEEESFEKAERYDGLWILVTNITKENENDFLETSNFSSYFEIYRLKNTIEESFKILSNFVGIEPFYVYKDEHVKAHFTICVLAYLINVTILNKVRSSKRIENMSLEGIFHELRKCKQDIIRLKKGYTISKITNTTAMQEKILDVLNCKYLISSDYLFQRQIVSV